MKLWKRAAGALKDHNSILLATILTPRTSSRNGTLEAAIIKATSHDGATIDYRSAQRVVEWIRRSPVSLKPLVWGLCLRMERTHSWVVAIKGLMLMHGILCCKTPLVLKIGRLPFDLSEFSDGHSSATKMWGFNAFVRSYYTFLDQRTALLYPSANKKGKTNAATTEEEEDQDHENHDDAEDVIKKAKLSEELAKLQKWQELLDLLLEIKPLADNMKRSPLILEAMDCVTIEIFDLYGNICRGMTCFLMEAGKAESDSVLRILQKARTQGKNLASYFELCRAFDVFNAMGVPKIAQIVPDDLEEMVAKKKGCDDDDDDFKYSSYSDRYNDVPSTMSITGRLQTVITDKWEVFEEDHNRPAGNYNYNGDQYHQLVAQCDVGFSPSSSNPFEDDQVQVDDLLSFVPIQPTVYKQEELPDLISF